MEVQLVSPSVTQYAGGTRMLTQYKTYLPKPSLVKGHSDFTDGFHILQETQQQKRTTQRMLSAAPGTVASALNLGKVGDKANRIMYN